MHYSELHHHLKKGNFHACYFFAGEEDFLIEKSVEELVQLLVDPATKDFNLDIFYAGQSDVGKILDIANAYPMLANYRLVIVKEVHKLSTSGIERLVAYMRKPAASTKLVLISQTEPKGKVMASLKGAACFVEFKPLYDNKVPAWIQEYVQIHALQISYEATLLIHAHIGNNLRAIVNEIEKIRLNLDGKDKIEEADVQKVVGLARNFSVFNLNDAIGMKELKRALMILNQMLESGESHTGILTMITRHFQNLSKIRGALKEKKGTAEITKLTGIPAFFHRQATQMAKNFSAKQYQTAFECLLNTDFILKTSAQAPQVALQTLLFKILR